MIKDYKITRVEDKGNMFIKLDLFYNDYSTSRLLSFTIDSEGVFYLYTAPDFMNDEQKEEYNKDIDFIYNKVGYSVESIPLGEY